MNRYLAWSASVHAALLAVFFAGSIFSKPARKYYAIDFLGGNSGFGPGMLEEAPAPAPAAQAKTRAQEAAEARRAEDKNRIAVRKEEKKPAKAPKNAKASKTAAPPPDVPARKGGEAGGRGSSTEGKGDTRAAKEGPVGGIGTALEIGGFGPGGSGTIGAQFPFKWYVNIVYKKLWQSWQMRDASNKECLVAFAIATDGALKDLKIEESSGDSVYDFLAKRAVEVSAPFPRLPEGFEDPLLRVIVRFKLQ